MEARRYARAADRFAEAAIKSESSLAWLNIGQSAITNLMMGGAMAFTVIGWAEGRFTPGDVVLVTDTAAVEAIVGAGMRFERAQELGLVRLYGSAAQVSAVQAWLGSEQ